ncbi:MAG TPA: hypothetical protein DDZ80_31050, partial [Cyanobacteria bacterium UBA8803]|nr:hypothetical protein [Cyanobacteria bacterium UBA8803]
MTDLYTFTYTYGNGDLYSGYGFANSGTFATGQTFSPYANQLGLNGFYTITGVLTNYGSSSDVGLVYVSDYFDGDASGQNYTPLYYSQGLASGYIGLGSELDYISGDITGFDDFGRGFYEADAANVSMYTFYYDYGNGDYYSGYVIGSDLDYIVGATYDSGTYTGPTEIGTDGFYQITGEYSLDASFASSLGDVFVTSYVDGDTSGQTYIPYYYSLGFASGSNYLGSEVDYIFGAGTGYDYFGYDYYEADAAGISLYYFTYDYGNGDQYYGYTFA